MISPQEFGALQQRVARVERFRERVIDVLPLVVVVGMLAGQFYWLDVKFERIDDRLDKLEAQVAEVLRRLPPPHP